MTATAILTYLPALDPQVFLRWAAEAKANANAAKKQYDNQATHYVEMRVHDLRQVLSQVNRPNQAPSDKISEQVWIDNACETEQKKARADVKTIEQGHTMGSNRLYSLRLAYLSWQRAEQTLKLAHWQAARTKATPAKVRVAVINSYPIRDTLRADGYKFGQDGHWHDPVGAKTSPAWVKQWAAEDRAGVDAALAKLQSLGVACRTAAPAPWHCAI